MANGLDWVGLVWKPFNPQDSHSRPATEWRWYGGLVTRTSRRSHVQIKIYCTTQNQRQSAEWPSAWVLWLFNAGTGARTLYINFICRAHKIKKKIIKKKEAGKSLTWPCFILCQESHTKHYAPWAPHKPPFPKTKKKKKTKKRKTAHLNNNADLVAFVKSSVFTFLFSFIFFFFEERKRVKNMGNKKK